MRAREDANAIDANRSTRARGAAMTTMTRAAADKQRSTEARQPDKAAILDDGSSFTVIHADGKSFSSFRVSMRELDGRCFVWQVGRGPKKNLYVGELDPAFGDVSPTKKSKKPHSIEPLALLNDVLPRIWRDDELPEGIEVLAAVSCEECRGRLTSPKSIERKLGPSCERKLREREKRRASSAPEQTK